ncbi:family 43 glycosylhydrolase [Alkalihalobacillus trypoxylicola]|uniref:family 43 glycosylhydrolase n=1 Tax=Alkalihalobacillus trypoxylicola TaxID=519424 RepID=UPI000ADB650F|nr:family 43 glycosylhydrolase [Alkalihalobacillus trypoxylicola]
MKENKLETVMIEAKLGEEVKLPNAIKVPLSSETSIEIEVVWDLEVESFNEAGIYPIEGRLAIEDYPNPLIEQRADPYIYKHSDGYYYFTGSYPSYDRIVLRRAKTIKALKTAEEKVIWQKYDQGIMGNHIWAPEIHYINNSWFIHFAAGSAEDKWAIRPYVLQTNASNPLEGDWKELGQINLSFDSFSLDATTFEHQNTRYLIWAQKPDNAHISNLYIAEMENPWTIKGSPTLLAQPEYSWEQDGERVCEGASVIKRNGKIFVTYSASGTDDRYMMGLLTINEEDDLLNSAAWTKSSEPIFFSSVENSEYGPGHNSFTVNESGEDLLVYHSRSYKDIEGHPLYDPNRHTRVQRMFWDSKGFPFFGEPGQTKKLQSLIIEGKVIVHKEYVKEENIL